MSANDKANAFGEGMKQEYDRVGDFSRTDIDDD